MDIERRKKYFKGLLPYKSLAKEFEEKPEKTIEVQDNLPASDVAPWEEEELRTLKFE